MIYPEPSNVDGIEFAGPGKIVGQDSLHHHGESDKEFGFALIMPPVLFLRQALGAVTFSARGGAS